MLDLQKQGPQSEERKDDGPSDGQQAAQMLYRGADNRQIGRSISFKKQADATQNE